MKYIPKRDIAEAHQYMSSRYTIYYIINLKILLTMAQSYVYWLLWGRDTMLAAIKQLAPVVKNVFWQCALSVLLIILLAMLVPACP